MKCPSCGHVGEADDKACAKCSLIFAKWHGRNEHPLESPPLPPSSALGKLHWESSIWIKLLLVVLLLKGGYWTYHKFKPDKPPPVKQGGTSAVTGQSPEQSAAATSGKQVLAQRLQPLLDTINAEGQGHGISVTYADLNWIIETESQNYLHPARISSCAKDAGLPDPQRIPFTSDEKKILPKSSGGASPAAKCLVGGEWKYLDSPVSSGEASECYIRDRGNQNTGPVMFINQALDSWVRQYWHPSLKTWYPYEPSDVERGLHCVWDKELGTDADRRDREQFDSGNKSKSSLIAAYHSQLIREVVNLRLAGI
jgi:hypothetical protein